MFTDINCTIEHNGISFSSGGAILDENGGTVYGDYDTPNYASRGQVTNWHGTIKINANYGKVYRSNFGDKRRSVRFTHDGINYYGVWCSIDWNQSINVRRVR